MKRNHFPMPRSSPARYLGPATSEVKTEESTTTLEKRAAIVQATFQRAEASAASTGSEARKVGGALEHL